MLNIYKSLIRVVIQLYKNIEIKISLEIFEY